MRISLFSQSLFALDLPDAIAATARAGYSAVELAAAAPHFALELARTRADEVADEMRRAGLTVAALSLFNPGLSQPDAVEAEVEAAIAFIRTAPAFETRLVKLTPGQPGSAEASKAHWRCLASALERLIPVAQECNVRLAVETHMRQLTDTLASSQRLLEMVPDETVGLTLDFLNLASAGEDVAAVIRLLAPRTYHCHAKNGYQDDDGGWHFQALDEGWLDYAKVLAVLAETDYGGFISVECLGADAREQPFETARRDLTIMQRSLGEGA